MSQEELTPTFSRLFLTFTKATEVTAVQLTADDSTDRPVLQKEREV